MKSSILCLLAATFVSLVSPVSAQDATHGRLGPRGTDPWNLGIDPEKPAEQPGLVTRHNWPQIFAPQIFIITHFDSERQALLKHIPELKQRNIKVPGFSPLFPTAACNHAGTVCLMTTGEGEINAAVSLAALLFSFHFDLSCTYFLVTGIGGINPAAGTTGTVTFARWIVQLDLTFEIDAREIPSNFSSGLIPLQNNKPVFYDPSIPPADPRSAYPRAIYGTEVYQLNAALRDRFLSVATTSNPPLADSPLAASYRQRYAPSPLYTPATLPPRIINCDSQSSNVFWSGALLQSSFAAYTQLLTNGSSHLCITQQEDNATLEALLRGHAARRLDFRRVAIMRTGSDFDRAPPGGDEAEHLLFAEQGGFPLGLENLGIVARPIVDDVARNWAGFYRGGVRAENWVGSLLARY